jgi:hypothetical protein
MEDWRADKDADFSEILRLFLKRRPNTRAEK